MSFQDNFFLGFKLFSRFYALPISAVYQVFHQEPSEQQSHILKIDEMIVFEGEPFYLSRPDRVLPSHFDVDYQRDYKQNQQDNVPQLKMPWVIVLKNRNAKSAKKGLGFRVEQIFNPFALNNEQHQSSVGGDTIAEKKYHVILI